MTIESLPATERRPCWLFLCPEKATVLLVIKGAWEFPMCQGHADQSVKTHRERMARADEEFLNGTLL